MPVDFSQTPASQIAADDPAWAMPLDTLAAKVQSDSRAAQAQDNLIAAQEQAARVATRAGIAASPSVEPDGFGPEGYALAQKQNGEFEVKLKTGEIYKGDAASVMAKMAKSQVHTKEWAQGFKQQLEAIEQQPQQQVAPPPDPVAQAISQGEAEMQDFFLDQQAKGLGLSGAEEYRRVARDLIESNQKLRPEKMASEFIAHCPDFPATDESYNVLGQIMGANNWDVTVNNLTAAHAMAVRLKAYNPLSETEVRQRMEFLNAQTMAQAGYSPSGSVRNMGAPPPIPPAGQPEMTAGNTDLWNMPMDQLRRQIASQTGGVRP